ncbi:Metallo-hydrolase/oxidoreductase [Biscogniauxia mediterranea]|nr:Metallo-hydrolase/oxidoreductase [Biscogniauxia mediterranea]
MTTAATTTTTTPSDAVTLTFLSTGTVRVRQPMLSQPAENKVVLMRRLRSLLDSNWSAELPIGAFLISHPQGPILFDTGESPRCNDPGFLPFYSPVRAFSRTAIQPDDDIAAQLQRLGVRPRDLQAVVLSHLHGDHAGGLADLVADDGPPVYVSREHWAAFGHAPVAATLAGCNPQRWPPGFAPRLLDPVPVDDDDAGPWPEAARVTADGRVLAVATPGHVPGHVSLVVRGHHYHHGDPARTPTPTTYFLPGDATYTLDALDREEPDGITADPEAARQTLRLIKEFARRHRGADDDGVVVLPSHDPDTPALLRDRTVYRPRARE